MRRLARYLEEIMNLIGIGSHVINLEQVTRIQIEDGSVTFFFANMMPVGSFGGAEKPDKIDQLKFLGIEAIAIKKFLRNDKYVRYLDNLYPQSATAPNPDIERWELDNNFPAKSEWVIPEAV